MNSFKTEEDALALSNDTNLGLMAGVFTQDINKALRMASEFESGMVGINCISLMMVTAPFGGSKESGVGRECGIHALRAFTEPKTIMINMNYYTTSSIDMLDHLVLHRTVDAASMHTPLRVTLP